MKKYLAALLLGCAFVLGGVLPSEAASRFLVACTTACTWDGSSTAIWSTTSGGAPGSSVPGSGDTVTLDANTCVGGVTCTITVNTTVNVQSITMGACTASTAGCILDFSANNNSVALSIGLTNTGTGTRTLNMGNGTWTLSSASGGNVIDHTTITGLTFNANSSKILVQASSAPAAGRALVLNTLSYNQIEINDPVETVIKPVQTVGAATIATLTLTNAYWIEFGGGSTITITNDFVWNGSLASPKLMKSQSTNTAPTLSVGGVVSLNWVFIQNITKAGAGSITATNSLDGGGNTGITISGPGGGGHIIGG